MTPIGTPIVRARCSESACASFRTSSSTPGFTTRNAPDSRTLVSLHETTMFALEVSYDAGELVEQQIAHVWGDREPKHPRDPGRVIQITADLQRVSDHGGQTDRPTRIEDLDPLAAAETPAP